jgi:hypothetical protein
VKVTLLSGNRLIAQPVSLTTAYAESSNIARRVSNAEGHHHGFYMYIYHGFYIYICMYIYVYMYVYVYMYIYICVYIYICIWKLQLYISLSTTYKAGNVLWRNNETRSCSYWCRAKTIIIAYSACVCSSRYPLCNAHAPYCHLWSVRLYYFFSTLYNKQHDFLKVTEHKQFVLIFSTTITWNISHFKNNCEIWS